jgi:PAS domain S-box-containing protein
MADRMTAWKREWRLERIVLPLLIAALVLVGLVFNRDTEALRVQKAEIDRVTAVLQANQDLLSALQDIETGQRGYLLTGDRSYLDPYQAAKRRMAGILDRLSSRVVRPDQKARVERLRALTLEKMVDIEATLFLYEQRGREEALSVVRSNQGKATMDVIRQMVREVHNTADGNLRERSAELDSLLRQSRLAVVGAAMTLAGLLGLTLWLIQRANGRRQMLMEQVERESQRFFTTLASIGDGVVTTDAQGRITYLNPVAESLTGWSSAEAKERPIREVFQLFHETTGETVPNPIFESLEHQRIVALANHTNLVRRDGTSVPIDDSAAPILSGGELAGAVMVFRDVTPRRQAEAHLRRWEQVFQGAGFGMMILTPGMSPELEQTNSAFARMHGHEPGDMAGMSYRELVLPEEWPAKAGRFSGETGVDHWATESVHVRKDGSFFPVATDYTLVRDLSGAVAYCIGYCSDITARKQAEQELRESEARYRLTADSLPQLIWTSRADGGTEYLNQRWRDQIGVAEEDLPSQDWTSVVFGEDRQTCREKWLDALKSGDTFQADCRVQARSDDAPRWYTCRAVPLRDGQGRVVRWFGSCTDTHDQRMAVEALRQSKEELQRSNEELERSNADLEQFAYAASHDLQEPLRMVAIYSQLIADEYGQRLDDQAKTYLQFAVEGAQRMDALLKDLLSFSRAARGEAQVTEPVDADAALQEALANLAGQIQGTGAVVDADPLPPVRMPKVHLVQVLQNLISNSIKYAQPGIIPMIRITSQPHPEGQRISVRDNGIGIDQQYQEQVFKLFGRLHTRDVPGTGIGLALCRKLVERNGGEIALASKVGEGSTFSFTVKT